MLHPTDDHGERKGVRRASHIAATLALVTFFTTPMFVHAASLSSSFRAHADTLAEKAVDEYGEMASIAGLLHDYDTKLILSVIVVESEANPRAVSRVGAQGLMQLMPATARAMGAKDPKEPLDNILAGTKYLKHLEEDYKFETVEEALVAYNMGPNRAKRWLSQYQPEESSYVRKVMYVYGLLEEKETRHLAEVKEGERTAGLPLTPEEFTQTAANLFPIFTKPRALSMVDIPAVMRAERRPELVSE